MGGSSIITMMSFVIYLRQEGETRRDATRPSTHPTPLTSTTQPMKDEDAVKENILIRTAYPNSLTQENIIRGDIMCRSFYAQGADLILDVRIIDADNPINKV